MSHSIRWQPAATRDLERLPDDVQGRIMACVDALAENPRPVFSAPLKGPLAGLVRLRIGDYRVAYLVDDAQRTLGILTVGHRSRFYEVTRRRVGS